MRVRFLHRARAWALAPPPTSSLGAPFYPVVHVRRANTSTVLPASTDEGPACVSRASFQARTEPPFCFLIPFPPLLRRDPSLLFDVGHSKVSVTAAPFRGAVSRGGRAPRSRTSIFPRAGCRNCFPSLSELGRSSGFLDPRSLPLLCHS